MAQRRDLPAAPTLESFDAEVLAFLEANAERATREQDEPPSVALLESVDPDRERTQLAVARRWSALAFDAGLGWISGPVQYGGRGLGPEFEERYAERCGEFAVPSMSVFATTRSMIAPALLHHGPEPLRRQFLPAFFRGDVLACQLFSEPEAGSDLASVRARAVRDGDDWVVTGQKVWTSAGHLADVGELLVRTDADAPKHRGLSMFLVDMQAPGVEVRPLRQMSGGAAFNEVFLADVRVPDARRIGELHDGWRVTLTTLMKERETVGAGETTRRVELFERLRETAPAAAAVDRVLRDLLADIYARERVLEWFIERGRQTEQSAPVMSIAKLLFVESLQRATHAATAAAGPALIARDGPGGLDWDQFTIEVPAMRIAGGTDEIMRNILAERVLGLPKS